MRRFDNVVLSIIQSGFYISEGATPSNFYTDGMAEIWHVVERDCFSLLVSWIKWGNGELSIECSDVESPIELQRLLVGRLRLTVSPHPLQEDMMFCTLKIAQRKKAGLADWANLLHPALDDLDIIAGESIDKLFSRFGAELVGSRAEVIGDESKLKGVPAVVFNPQKPIVGIVAFVLTRVFPLLPRQL